MEEIIFSQLLCNQEYVRIVLPHLKEEYFASQEEKNFFKIYKRFFQKYSKIPSKEALLIEIEALKSSADVYTSMKNIISRQVEFTENLEYLVEKTEEYCKERAVYNALRESVLIVDGQSKDKTSQAIPAILQEALSVCFDTSVGHNYLEDSEDRYDYYHLSEARIPTGIPMIDKVCRGGFPRKTLNVLLAPPHGGKSLVMVNAGIGALNAGHNVLFISMEMSEEEIGKRFDVNLMDVTFDDLEMLPKDTFNSRFNKVTKSARGRLIIKEYPTGAANVGHFRSLLQELKTKQNFIPDMIIVDYMSICSSEVYKPGANANTYLIVGSIAKELRALGIENNCCILTAIQTTRAGIGNSDVNMSDTSESFGVPAHADWFGAIINTDELKELKQILFKQLKNRYSCLADNEKFLVGVDYSKMKLFELEGSAQSIPLNNKKQSHIKTAKDTFEEPPVITKTSSFSDFNF